MSSYYHNGKDPDDRDRKLSGFAKREGGEAAETAKDGQPAVKNGQPAKEGKESKSRKRRVLARRGRRLWVALLVDVILLLLVVGLVVGGVFAYRALRNLYAPVWEMRDVVFGVRIENLPPDRVQALYNPSTGQYSVVGNPIWSSELTDADMLGTVTGISTVMISTEDGNTVTLYLEVKAKAYYREGKGYRMGETLLLAGSTGTYRLEGLAAEGMITYMREASDTRTATACLLTDRYSGAQNR